MNEEELFDLDDFADDDLDDVDWDLLFEECL